MAPWLQYLLWAVLLGGGAFTVYKFIKGRDGTAPKGNQPNTGQPWRPGPQQPIPDNQPKPKPPPKDEV